MTKEEALEPASKVVNDLPNMKTQEDISRLTAALQKITLEKILKTEPEEYLKNEETDSKNGYSQKTIKTENGSMTLDTPRDRNSTFEPVIIKKKQRKVTSMDDKIFTLYAKGMTTRDIADTFKELYNTEISAELISKVTEVVMDEVIEWQNRPLDELYPILYLDCIVVKVKQDKRIINKSIYLALAVNLEGKKELLGLWINENEGSKFWLSVLTELQNRGVREIYIACVDGLSGFPEAINAVFPKTKVRLCMVHMVRNSLKYVSYKNAKEVASDLKKIYTSINAEEAERELQALENKWDAKYPKVSQSWRSHWANIITLFDYPDAIRRVIYTTNAIESLNSVIRKAVRNRKIFPNDSAAFKVVYLAIEQASKKWTMPLRTWKDALNYFEIETSKSEHEIG